MAVKYLLKCKHLSSTPQFELHKFPRFLQAFMHLEDRMSPLLLNNFQNAPQNKFEGVITPYRSSKQCFICFIEDQICVVTQRFSPRRSSTNGGVGDQADLFHYKSVAHFNNFFATRGGNLNKPIVRTANAREVAGGDGGWDIEAFISLVHYLENMLK